jgi:Flp pilus assembly protein TadB
MAWLVSLAGAMAGVGLLITVSGWSAGRPRAPRSLGRRWSSGELFAPMAAAFVGAAVALFVTGWLVAVLAGALGGFAVVQLWRRRGVGGRAEQTRIEALASWCEQLRDLLSAEHGIEGTIRATVRTCPEAILPEVMRLSTRLGRQSAASAVGQFADEMDDPSADLVASVLLLAMHRSGGTAELLSELAATIRERAAMRLRVEAERSGQRSEARFVVVFSALAVSGVLIFGRGSDFLDAYDDGTGQLVLAVVFAMFAFGGWWMARLTRFARPARFLTVGDEGAGR